MAENLRHGLIPFTFHCRMQSPFIQHALRDLSALYIFTSRSQFLCTASIHYFYLSSPNSRPPPALPNTQQYIFESLFSPCCHRTYSEQPNMEKPSLQDHDHAHAPEDEDRRQKCHKFKGIRLRKWGSWVSEIRMPRSREKLWLGSYPSAQQAARAYDAAVYCLRGPSAKFNFPNSVPDIPSASSLSRRQIQVVATKYALDRLPSSPTPLQSISNKATEEVASPSKSSSVSETELSSDSHQISEEQELDLRECLFEVSDGNDGCLGLKLQRMPSIEEVSALELIHTTWQEQQEVDLRECLFEMSDGNDGCLGLNLERMPSIEEVSALELIRSTWQDQRQEEDHMNILIDPTELWNF